MKNIFSFNLNHLKDNQMTYFIHFKKAFIISIFLMLAGLACLVHAIVPFIFTNTASNILASLKARYKSLFIKGDK